MARLFTVVYGNLDERLVRGLERSARENSPDTPLTVRRVELAVGDEREFVHKAEAWRDEVNGSPDGDVIVMIDADCLVLKSLAAIESADFDIAHAPRRRGYRYNLGVLAVRVSRGTREFMSAWAEMTALNEFIPRHRDECDKKWGSTDQAAFADLLPGSELTIGELEDDAWNLCQDWERLSERTRILHFRGRCSRRLLKGDFDGYPDGMCEQFRKYCA
jgi:hypothetical protein